MVPRETSSALALETSSAIETDETNTRQEVLRIQKLAAKEAQTVREFGTNFRRNSQAVLEGKPIPNAMGEGAKLGEEFQYTPVQRQRLYAALTKQQQQVVDPATKGFERMEVAHDMDPDQLGEAYVGKNNSERLSADMFGDMNDEADVKQARHAGRHEKTHTEDVAELKGNLIVNGEDKTELLRETRPELEGNEEVGMAATEYRPNQPKEYKDAQDVGIKLLGASTKAKMEETLAGDGDLNRLQEDLDAKGMGRTQEQIEQAQVEGEEEDSDKQEPIILKGNFGNTKPTPPEVVSKAG